MIDPLLGRPLREPAACVVLAGSAATSEVYSTALLCMRRTKARDFASRLPEASVMAAWIESGTDRPTWEWWKGAPS